MNKFVIGSILTFSCISCTKTYAEGTLNDINQDTGASIEIRGANRRVLTNPNGYSGVRGTFTVPQIFIPNRTTYNPFDPHTGNYARSNATFYLGSRQERSDSDSTEVDAGFQYESSAIITTDRNGNNITAPPGWSAFVRTTGSQWADFNPAAGSSNNPLYGWRFPSGYTDVNMTWSFQRASSSVGYHGYLDVEVVGAPQNLQPEGVGSIGRIYGNDGERMVLNLGGMRMKRVVGITQGYTPDGDQSNLTFGEDINGNTHFEEDGSYMIGCRFYNGQISSNLGAIWVPWTIDTIDQAQTGSYPAGQDMTYLSISGYAKGAGSLPYISFPKGAGQAAWPTDPTWTADTFLRGPERGEPNALYANRYSDETVSAWLRRYKGASGRAVAPGQ